MRKRECRRFQNWLSGHIHTTLTIDTLPIAFRDHVDQCASCQQLLNLDRALKEKGQAMRSRIPAPDIHLFQRERTEGERMRPVWLHRPLSVGIFSAIVFVIIVFTASFSYFFFHKKKSRDKLHTLIQTAITTHRQMLQGGRYDYQTDNPQQLEAWVKSRVPYPFNLPDAPDPERKPYTLEGARLLPFQDHSIVYIGYRMNQRLISLIASPSDWVRPGGNRISRIGSIDFYVMNQGPYRIITWEHEGMTYVQISPIQITDEKSCSLCHPLGFDASSPL